MKISRVINTILILSSIILSQDIKHVAVAPFSGEGFWEEDLTGITESFRKEYNTVAQFDVMEKAGMDSLLKAQNINRMNFTSKRKSLAWFKKGGF